MKIALVINELNIRGGTHKQLMRLADYLIRKGHVIRIFTKFYESRLCFPELAQMDVVSYEKYFKDGSKLQRLKGYFKMAKDITNFSNIVNIHDNGYAIMQLIFSVKYSKASILWQINDLPAYFKVGNTIDSAPGYLDGVIRKIYKKVAKDAKLITVNVTKNSERIKEHYNIDSKVIYCGVDLKNPSLPTPPPNRNEIRLLSIGVFFPYRNYETFLKVIDYINLSLKIECEGILVGSTALDPLYAEDIAAKAMLNNTKCKILGNISEQELNDIYQTSDFFLFLNKDQSWGLAVFEAMNLGMPVILSKSVGATEILEDTKHAIFVDPMDYEQIANKIVELHNKSELKNDLITNAFSHTINMTWDNMYSSKIEEIFDGFEN